MIEFQYFPGCPHSPAVREHLQELVREGFLSREEIVITEVPDLETAERVHFQGSPTLLVEGFDLYTGEKPRSSSYACRRYALPGEKKDTLTLEFIKRRIQELRSDP